jgi:hypothetical protein
LWNISRSYKWSIRNRWRCCPRPVVGVVPVGVVLVGVVLVGVVLVGVVLVGVVLVGVVLVGVVPVVVVNIAGVVVHSQGHEVHSHSTGVRSQVNFTSHRPKSMPRTSSAALDCEFSAYLIEANFAKSSLLNSFPFKSAPSKESSKV